MENFKSRDLDIDLESLKFIHPFRLILSGGSSTGKTEFVFKFLENISQITIPPIDTIIYLYGEFSDRFSDFKDKFFFTKNLNYLDYTPKPGKNVIIVIDDLMNDLTKSQQLLHLFTRSSHHRRLSVILILQNIFLPSPIFKTLRDNCTYYGLTEHISDYQKVEILSRQLEGKNNKYFMESYEDCVSKPYRVFFVDLHPQSKLRKICRYRTQVYQIPGQILYLDKKQIK